MIRRRARLLVSVPLLALIAATQAAAQAPAVVVSIKPLHSLVAAVMDGVGRPSLLIKESVDPHTYALKPSDAQALDSARLVVWAGPGVESFLDKPLKALAGKARVVQLDTEKSLKLLPIREGGAWEADADAPGEKQAHAPGKAHAHGEIDGHLWLDPDNAAGIVRLTVRELSRLDQANGARYAANGDRAVAAVKALDAELRAKLAPVKAKRFIVLHDSIQYFEKRYGLAAAGSITLSPEHAPSAKRLHDIRSRILKQRVDCVFGEPQLPDRLVKTVTEGTPARTGVIDTDGGAGLREGKDAYFQLMRNLVGGLSDCLGKS